MIHIEAINKENMWDFLKLEVHENQVDFVASNTESILEAYAALITNEVALPFGIYNKNNIPIGFLMFGYGRVDEDDPEIANDNYVLWRFMIDKNHQHKGYGKEALNVAINYIRDNNNYNAKHCWISYEPENKVARDMYLNFGFKENGELCDGELVAVIDL